MRISGLLVVSLLFLPAPGGADTPGENGKILRQKTRLLRACPKRFAVFRGADAARGEVDLLMEEEKDPRVWTIDPDAEIKVHGFWGRLEDLKEGDRVWAWIRLDRKERPVSLFMVADEISEQAIHDLPYTLESVDAAERTITVERKGDEPRTLKLDESLHLSEEGGAFVFSSRDQNVPHQPAARLSLKDSVYVQTAGRTARIAVGRNEFEELRESQRARLRERWRREGLPGTVGLIHRFAGEAELALDHEAMRWARALEPGAPVEIEDGDVATRAVVLEVRPWRERTRLRLAARGGDLSDVSPGRRVLVRLPEPSAETLGSRLPPDLGRERSEGERVDWFLSSTYCGCSIAGDGCTGMFYTLAGCNPETCGMPQRIRKMVRELIEEGLSDREILAKLEEERGEVIFRQHLLR